MREVCQKWFSFLSYDQLPKGDPGSTRSVGIAKWIPLVVFALHGTSRQSTSLRPQCAMLRNAMVGNARDLHSRSIPHYSKGFLGFMNETNQMTEINQISRLCTIYWHNIVGSSVSCFEQKSLKIADSPIFALSGSCGISRFRPRSVELSARNERGFAEKCAGSDLKRLRHGGS